MTFESGGDVWMSRGFVAGESFEADDKVDRVLGIGVDDVVTRLGRVREGRHFKHRVRCIND